MSSALDFLEGLVPVDEVDDSDEQVGSSSVFAKPEEFVKEYGEDFIREVQIVDARKRYRAGFNHHTKQYDGDDEPTITIMMTDADGTEFIFDTKPVNRQQMINALQLGKIPDGEWSILLNALPDQIFIIQPRWYPGLKQWGFVFSQQREIARIGTSKNQPAQQQAPSNRQAPTRR